MASPKLQIQYIEKHYSNHTALSGVTFDVPQGSIFGLLGPNGTGKTSLIRIITQITGADKGQVLLDKKTVPIFLVLVTCPRNEDCIKK